MKATAVVTPTPYVYTPGKLRPREDEGLSRLTLRVSDELDENLSLSHRGLPRPTGRPVPSGQTDGLAGVLPKLVCTWDLRVWPYVDIGSCLCN